MPKLIEITTRGSDGRLFTIQCAQADQEAVINMMEAAWRQHGCDTAYNPEHRHEFDLPDLPDPSRIVSDGFGSAFVKCDRPDCDLRIVRPGKAQCWCEGRHIP